MDMAKDFEGRFFDLLQKNLNDLGEKVDLGFADTNKKIEENTKVTEKIKTRVDKLDGKVFAKKTTFSNLFQDKQIVIIFLFALLVFLLILAAVMHVEVPAWL